MGSDDKLMTLPEAIKRFVTHGCSLVTGTYMEQKIPFAAAHEIIRQNIRDLTLMGPISDVLFDQLIGAGCVSKVHAAWVGNVMMGSAYNFRRAVEQGIPRQVDVVDYTNFTFALGLHASALGVPFLPTRSTLGSSILEENPNLIPFRSPIEAGGVSDSLVAVKAILPDVAIVHACKADASGNGMVWGNLGVTVDAVSASSKVIVMAEEIVSSDLLRRDPNRILIQGFQVDAVCHVPFGCHPSPVLGYYNRDNECFAEYHRASKTPEGFGVWLDEWVTGIPDWDHYLTALGSDRQKSLRPKNPLMSDPVITSHG